MSLFLLIISNLSYRSELSTNLLLAGLRTQPLTSEGIIQNKSFVGMRSIISLQIIQRFRRLLMDKSESKCVNSYFLWPAAHI